MKQHNLLILIMAVFFSFMMFVPMAVGAQKIQPKPAAEKSSLVKCTEPPDAQVVNNSGVNIFQVKVGKVVFHENLSSCADGCSTGFQKIAGPSNPIAVKMDSTSSWVNIGSLGNFEGCLNYAVNIVKKGNTLCAELYLRKNTDSTFNNDTTKKKISQTCKTMAAGPAVKKPVSSVIKKGTVPAVSGSQAAPQTPGAVAMNPGQMQMEFPKPVISGVIFRKAVDNSMMISTAPNLPGGSGGSGSESVPVIHAEYGERLTFNCGFTTQNVVSLQVRLLDGSGGHTNPPYGEPREYPEGQRYNFQTNHIVREDEVLTLRIKGTGPGLGGFAQAEKQVRIESKSPFFEVKRPAVNDDTREVTFWVKNTGDMAFPPGDIALDYTIKGMPGNETIVRSTLRKNDFSAAKNHTVSPGTITLPESALAFDRIEMEMTFGATCNDAYLPGATGSYAHTWETRTFTINETLLSIFSSLFEGNVRINTFEEGHGNRSDSQPYKSNDSRLLLTVSDPDGPRPVFDQLIPIPSFKFGSDGVEALILIHNLEAPIDGRNLFFIRDGKLGLRIVFDCSANKEIEVWARDAIAKKWVDSWLPDLDLRGFSIELMLTPSLNGQAISYSALSMNANVNLEMPGHRVEEWLEREAASMIESSFAPVFDTASVKTAIENTFSQLVNNNPLVNIHHLVSVRGTGNTIVITYR